MNFNARALLLLIVLLISILNFLTMVSGLVTFLNNNGEIVNYITNYDSAYGLVEIILILNQLTVLFVILTELGREE